jgi:hypothetical protein
MKKIQLLFFSIAILGLISLNGCKTEGCTDPDSATFNTDADKDDGSCEYDGSIVFWYGEDAADGLTNDGATSLTFYLDGQIVGSTSTSVFWTAAPTCGDNASITATKDLSNVKTQSYSYRVVDQTDYEYWSGTVNINANTCLQQELSW